MKQKRQIELECHRTIFNQQILHDVYEMGDGDLGDRDTSLAGMREELVLAANLTKMFTRNCLEVTKEKSKIANCF